jgi:hypothetical protein
MLRILGNGESPCVHDEILLEAHAEMVSGVALILKETMEEEGEDAVSLTKEQKGFFFLLLKP